MSQKDRFCWWMKYTPQSVVIEVKTNQSKKAGKMRGGSEKKGKESENFWWNFVANHVDSLLCVVSMCWAVSEFRYPAVSLMRGVSEFRYSVSKELFAHAPLLGYLATIYEYRNSDTSGLNGTYIWWISQYPLRVSERSVSCTPAFLFTFFHFLP